MRTDAGPARPKRKKQAPSRGPQGLPGPRRTTYRPPQRTGVFAPGPPRPATRPITQAPARARQKVERAQRRLPARPVPRVPVLTHYTPAQVEAARSLIRRSGVNRTDAMQDPRTRAQLRGAAAAGRSDLRIRALRDERAARRLQPHLSSEEQMAALLGDRLAVLLGQAPMPKNPSGSLRTQRIRAGRALIAGQQRRDTVRPGPRRAGGLGGAATILANKALDYNDVRGGFSTLGTVGAGIGKWASPVAKDLLTLGEAPFVGGVAGLKALGEAAGPAGALLLPGLGSAGWLLAGTPKGGNLQPAKEFGGGLVRSLAESSPAALVTGHPGLALQRYLQHPIIETLNYGGAAGAVGRLGGAAARAAGSTTAEAGARGALARAGSTVRPALAMTDDASAARNGLIVPRTHSKDLGRKAAQVKADKRRAPLLDAEGKQVYVEDRGRRVPVLKASAEERARYARKRGDFDASRANSRERVARGEADVADHRTGRIARGRTGKLSDELRVWAVQGVLRTPETLRDDLLRHAARIREELRHPENYPTSVERDAAVSQADFAEKVASNPKVLSKAKRLFDVSHEHSRVLNAADAAAVAKQVLHPSVAERSPLMTYAISHMDARHVTADQHAALEADALKVEKAARDRLEQAAPADKPAARAALQAARDHRIAVSGRHPGKVRAHEAAHGASKAATRAHRQAQAAVARLEKKRQRLVGAQASRRGSRGHAGGDPSATALEARKLAKVDRDIAAAKTAEKAARKDARKARAKAEDTKLPPAKAGLRHADGRFLSNDEIRNHVRTGGGDRRAARHPDTLAYLPHRLEVELRSSHHAPFQLGTRANFAKGETRTGSLFRRGAASHDRGLLRDELAKKATHITKTEQLDRAITDMGMRHPAWAKHRRGEQLTKSEERVVKGGGYFNGKEALEEARRIKADTGEEWVPIRGYSSQLGKAAQEAIRGEHQDPAGGESLHSQLFNDRLKIEPASRARNVVLVPAEYATRLAKHLQPAGELNKFVQLLNAPFRMAVLPQPRWLTGNFVEPFVVRLPLSGGGANIAGLALDFAASRKALREMKKSKDPLERQAAAEIEAQQHGGLFIGRRGASNRRTYEDFTGRTQKALYVGHVLRNLPVMKQMVDLFLLIPKSFFHFNRYIESAAQNIGTGHQIRQDIHEFTGSWTQTLRLGKKAMAEARRGLRQTATQERFMRQQHILLGQYEGFSPALRSAIQSYAPFLPWTLAAARFVYWTLPAHHTATEAMLVQSGQSVQKEWDAAHDRAGALPGSLQDNLITDKGGFVDVARYTPFGFSEPIARGRFEGLAAPLLPQLSGVEAALAGQSPFHRDLKVKPTADNPKGTPSAGQIAGIVLNQILGGTVPNYANAQRILEHGGTAYADSNLLSPKTKPGSDHMSGLRRTFDPFRPTYLKAPTGGSAGAAVPSGGSRVQRDRVRRALEQAASRGPSAVQQDRIRRALERAGG